jgi:aryl-alcohol dehydrogenase-like predicted oxidoreductase
MLKAVQNLKKPLEPRGEFKQSRLILGTATFGMDYGVTNTHGEVSVEKIGRILDICRQGKICELDTAGAYGRAEKRLGDAGVADFAITTKIDLGPDESADAMHQKLAQSLEYLRVDKVATLLLHNEERLHQPDAEAVAGHLHKLVEIGLAGRAGFSSYEPSNAVRLCERFGLHAVQLPANALDQRLLHEGVLKQFLSLGVEVQIRSLFLQGLLLAEPHEAGGVPPEVLHYARGFRARCREEGLTPLRGAWGELRRFPKQVKAVFGVTSDEELDETLKNIAHARPLSSFKAPPWQKEFDPRSWKN